MKSSASSWFGLMCWQFWSAWCGTGKQQSFGTAFESVVSKAARMDSLSTLVVKCMSSCHLFRVILGWSVAPAAMISITDVEGSTRLCEGLKFILHTVQPSQWRVLLQVGSAWCADSFGAHGAAQANSKALEQPLKVWSVRQPEWTAWAHL